MNSDNIDDIYDLGKSVSINVQVLISLIGIVSNTLSVFVFERKKLKKHSYSIYWKIKACSDIIVLIHSFRHWSRHFLNADIDLISEFFCRFNEYQPFVASSISSCLETLITLDRLFTVVFANRFKIIKKRPFQITIISLAVAFSLLTYISLPLRNHLVEVSGTLMCEIPRETKTFIWVYSLANVIIINVMIIPILDLTIISHIISSRRTVRRLKRTAKTDRKFAINAISLNLTGLLLKLPLLIGSLLSIYFNLGHKQTEMVFSICLSVILLEKIDMFFVNVIVNSIFRREFLSMIGIRRSKVNKSNEIFARPSVSSRRQNASPV